MLHTLQPFIRCLNSLIFIQLNLPFLNLFFCFFCLKGLLFVFFAIWDHLKQALRHTIRSFPFLCRKAVKVSLSLSPPASHSLHFLSLRLLRVNQLRDCLQVCGFEIVKQIYTHTFDVYIHTAKECSVMLSASVLGAIGNAAPQWKCIDW